MSKLLHICDLKKGDYFTEQCHGQVVRMRANENARCIKGEWFCNTTNTETGEDIEYFHSTRADPNYVYEPRIYSVRPTEEQGEDEPTD